MVRLHEIHFKSISLNLNSQFCTRTRNRTYHVNIPTCLLMRWCPYKYNDLMYVFRFSVFCYVFLGMGWVATIMIIVLGGNLTADEEEPQQRCCPFLPPLIPSDTTHGTAFQRKVTMDREEPSRKREVSWRENFEGKNLSWESQLKLPSGI